MDIASDNFSGSRSPAVAQAAGSARYHQADILGFMLIILSAAAFGFSPVGGKLAFGNGSNPLTVAILRYGLNATMIAGLCLLSGRSLRLAKPDMLLAWLAGAIMAGESVLYLVALTRAPISIVLMVFFTFPLQIALYMAITGREPLSMGRIICLLIAFAGIALTIGAAPAEVDIWGVLMAFVAGSGLAALTIILIPVTQRADPMSVSAHMAAAAMVVSLVALPLSPFSWALPINAAGWVGIAIATVIFAIGFLLYMFGIGRTGAVKAGLLFNIEPVVGVLAAIIILHEIPTLLQLAGIALILVALIALQIGDMRRKPATAGK